MFKIFMVNDNEFIVTGLEMPFTGTRIKTVAFLLQSHVSEDEIHCGLSELILHGHHVADYGVNKSFIYTSRVA